MLEHCIMSFSTSVSHVGATTGYSSNQGVWSRVQLQKPRAPFNKRRKRWYQSFGGDPSFYQISEKDEEEETSFIGQNFNLFPPRTGSSIRKLKSSNLSRESSGQNRRKNVTQENNAVNETVHGEKLTRKKSSELKLQRKKSLPEIKVSRQNSIPEIFVSAEDDSQEGSGTNSNYKNEDTTNARMKKLGLQETCKDLLMPPNIRTESPIHRMTVSASKSSKTKNNDSSNKLHRYLQAPKYTHIRVPRPSVLVTHVSQKSWDSTLAFPAVFEHHKPVQNGNSRKPIKISLSPVVNNIQISQRKSWNFRSKNEPFQIHSESPSNASNVSGRSLQNGMQEGSVSPNVRGLDTSLEAIRAKTLKRLCRDMHSDSYSSGSFKVTKTAHTRVIAGVNINQSVGKRKKWILPDYWPSQEQDNTDGRKKSNTPTKQRSIKTPRKSKRMAARLDGHSSTDVDTSKSASESTERPPLPHRKSEEKVSRKAAVQKSLEERSGVARSERSETEDHEGTLRPDDKLAIKRSPGGRVESEGDLDDTLKAPSVGGDMSSSISVASSQDDTPMLQKLKDMNKRDHNAGRKKDIPKWLKADQVAALNEGRSDGPDQGHESESQEVPRTPPTQEEINMLIDEELSMFPADKKHSAKQDLQTTQEVAQGATPMQRIQKNRSKWRETQGLTLEESWGSLTEFNKHQRGRLSLDMDDDVLDEYINKAAKMAGLPANPTIEEEEEGQTAEVDNTAMELDDDTFVIPELPYGKDLVISIGTTWGDKHYVGLTGIEAFSSTGEQINIVKIKADPSDINMLPEYKNDPRVVKNLIDGVNRTRDDIHMWLAPFVSGRDHLIFCTFDKPCKVAMLRIWNYNKSRIHSYRGARDVFIMLDSNVIFKGEIARACGGTEGGTEAFGDTILFTTDESILEAMSKNDDAYEGAMLSDDEPFDVERPSTADSGHGHERPFTRAVGNVKQLEREKTAVSPTPTPVPEYEGDVLVYRGQCVELNFTATWGDHHYLGLTGLEVVGKDGEALPLNMSMLNARPRDVRTLPGHERDDRTLDKLIDGVNVTNGDEHMWLIPFNAGQNHTLTITFNEKQLMAGLRLWNYNKSKEDTYRGAKIVHVSIDGKMVSPREGYLIRKGPGNCHFDFAQELSFNPQTGSAGMAAAGSNQSMVESEDYELYQMPCGFIYQLQLFTTWGDSYYVGLNGIEFYDGNLKKIHLTETNISAYPDSVNVLDNIQNDARTPDKLIDGINDTMDGGHMWLAPILPGVLNRVYVIFDQPTTISMIKVWNYSKTANRGAKDFALLVDDLLVYNGVLEALPKAARGILPTCEGPQPYHTILFTNNKEVLRREKHTIINHKTDEQDVQMTNDKKIVSHYSDPHKASSGKPVDQSKRPTTSVIHSKKRR